MRTEAAIDHQSQFAIELAIQAAARSGAAGPEEQGQERYESAVHGHLSHLFLKNLSRDCAVPAARITRFLVGTLHIPKSGNHRYMFGHNTLMQNQTISLTPKATSCPECKSRRIVRDYEKGELLCASCGLIIVESIHDMGPEWRAFDSEQKEKKARGGAPLKFMRPNKGLVTEIDQYNRDIRGGKISPKKQAQLYRMRKWHKRVSIATSMERNLVIALAELDRVASSLGLPENIKESAALLYRKAVKEELIRGRLIESVVAAVIYAICRLQGIPRTLDEISRASGIEKKEIGRAYRFLKAELHVDVPLTDPAQYVPKFATALKLGGEVQEEAVKLIRKALRKGLISGRGPTGVAAAALYIASAMHGEKKTQKEVADVAGVTEVTIRNRYRELKKELGLKVNL